jgi:hypothetical protein
MVGQSDREPITMAMGAADDGKGWLIGFLRWRKKEAPHPKRALLQVKQSGHA